MRIDSGVHVPQTQQPSSDLFAPPPPSFQEVTVDPETLVPPGSRVEPPKGEKPRRRRHWVRWAIGIGVVGLVGLRLALPTIVKTYVNHTLDKHPTYDGHVDDIDIALIRGAYAINGIEIVKENGAVPEPLFSADTVDLSIRWKALLKGKVVGEIELWTPELNLVNGADAESDQTGAEEGGEDWRVTVRELMPIQIDRFAIHDGEVHYVDRTAEPAVDVALTDLQLEALNLTNAERTEGSLISTVEATAQAEGTGGLDLYVRLDPFAEMPTFDSDVRVADVQLVQFNELISRYGKFDLQSGVMNVNLELASDQGVIAGYLKPILKDVKVTSFREIGEEKENPLRAAWEVTVGAVKGLLNNDKADQVAARIPISGDLSSPKPATWTAIWTIVENAFFDAIWDGLDHSVDFGDAGGSATAAPSGSKGKGSAKKGDDASAAAPSGEDAKSRESDAKQRRRDRRKGQKDR